MTTNWFSAWIFKSTNSGKSSQAKRNAHRHICIAWQSAFWFSSLLLLVFLACYCFSFFFRLSLLKTPIPSFFFLFHSIFRSLSIFADILSGPTTKTRDSQVKTFHPCITYTHAGCYVLLCGSWFFCQSFSSITSTWDSHDESVQNSRNKKKRNQSKFCETLKRKPQLNAD